MILVLLLAVALAQASNFVTLQVCYLDHAATPWEFRPHPTYPPARVQPRAVTGLIDARAGLGDIGGIHCTLLHMGEGSFFVVGSPEQVEKILKGKRPRDTGN